MIMECSYAVTAWTQAVEDEHRLLSQVLGVLFAFPQLPDDALAGRLAETAQRFAIEGKIGQPKSDGKADFWSAVGGQYKASLDYVVTLACESGVAYERGPEVRTQTMGTRIADAPASHDHRDAPLRRQGGRRRRRAAGRRLGHAARAGAVRRRRTPRAASCSSACPRGAHKLVARTRDGAEAKAEIAVPGAVLDLTVAPAKRAREEGRLTEWASAAARTTAPAPLARGCPDRRCWVPMPNDDPAGRACCWATSSRWSAWG